MQDNQLCLMAPGQTTTYQYEWQKPEWRRAERLGRRLPNGSLTLFAESKGQDLHITDWGDELELEVLLCTIQELHRGDIETGTVRITARRDRSAWRAAYRIARQVAAANPRTHVFLDHRDLIQVRNVAIPARLFTAIRIAGSNRIAAACI